MNEWMRANLLWDSIRTILSVFDMVAYFLLKSMYQIFFNVASANIFTGDAIRDIYFRIQLIIGIVMIFKLSVTIIQSIINPDKVSQKQVGMMSIIGRVFIVLILFTLITPLNIRNPRNDYETEIKDKGIIFGLLYSLQNRILCQNTIGKLILGPSHNSVTSSSKNKNEGGTCDLADSKTLENAGNRFASSILKVFVRINILKKDDLKDVPDNKEPEDDPSNWVCTDLDKDLVARYNSDTIDPTEILEYVTLDCDEAKMNNVMKESSSFKIKNKYKKLFVSGSYAFTYIPIAPTIVGFILTLVLLGFTIDIAIRAAKLTVLRMLAPIPIISYITPSKDNGTFGTWVKNVTSTYVDLFVRLAIIYFVINLIDQLIRWRVGHLHGIVGSISFVMIVVGLFIFAKEAPKFIKDVLGIKGTGSNVGLSALLGGAAMMTGAAGNRAGAAYRDSRAAGNGRFASALSAIPSALAGGATGFAQGAMIGERGAVDAYNQGKQMPLGSVWRQNKDLMEQIRTGDKDAKGGLFGRTLDRLNYANRDAVASSLGMSREDFARADQWKTQAATILGDKKAQYERAKNELTAWQNTHDKNAPDYETGYKNRVEALNRAYDDVAEWEIKAGKASSNAEKIDKYRAQLGAGPRVRDLVVDSYRSSTEVVKNPTLDSTNRVIDTPSNYQSAAKPFDPYKGAPDDIPKTTQPIAAGGTEHADDAEIPAMGGGSGGGPHGPH